MHTSLFLRSVETNKTYSIYGEMIIGRELDCTVVLDSPNVSRYHAKILVAPNAIFVEDLNSSNGTFVNGRRIHARTSLGVGDQVKFDELVYRITTAISGKADATQIGASTTQQKEEQQKPESVPAYTPPDDVPAKRQAASADIQVASEDIGEGNIGEREAAESNQFEPRSDEDIDPFADAVRARAQSIPAPSMRRSREGDSDRTEILNINQRSSIRSLNEQFNSDLNIGAGPRLVVMTAPIRGQVFPLSAGDHGQEWILGRADDASFHIKVSSVSRYHAKITKVFNGHQISALDASNGMLVNGVEKKQAMLNHKDTILMGRIKFVYRTDDQPCEAEIERSQVTYKDWIPTPILQFYEARPFTSAIIAGVCTFCVVLGLMLL